MGNILLSILVPVICQTFPVDEWVSSVEYDFRCGYGIVKLPPLEIWEAVLPSNIREPENDYQAAINEYKEILRDKLGSEIVDNIIFGKKWRIHAGSFLSGKLGYTDDDPIDPTRIYNFSSEPDFFLIDFTASGLTTYKVFDLPSHLEYEMIYLPAADAVFFYDDFYDAT